jgi:hypothetical protein
VPPYLWRQDVLIGQLTNFVQFWSMGKSGSEQKESTSFDF